MNSKRQAPRIALYIVSTLVLGICLFVAWVWFVFDRLGQGECDRGECSWIGDLTYGDSASIVLAACLVIAAAFVWGIGRLASRRRRRR